MRVCHRVVRFLCRALCGRTLSYNVYVVLEQSSTSIFVSATGFSFSAICPYAQFIEVRSPPSEGIICIKRKGTLLLAMGRCTAPCLFSGDLLGVKIGLFWGNVILCRCLVLREKMMIHGDNLGMRVQLIGYFGNSLCL